jgi:uncharacterized protein with NRDE domain
MCILFIAVKQHPDYPLIIAANRDEFHARLTTPAHVWPDNQTILAGKDEQAGGTWMGISTLGRLAALTNIRAPQRDRLDARTRGELVVNALNSEDADVAAHLAAQSQHYNGFNLVYGHWEQLQVFNSHDQQTHALTQGVYGLSNAALNTPWPKIKRGVAGLNKACQGRADLNIETLFTLLGNNEIAPDDELPDTGIAKPWEKMLSSIFICSPDYGTRSSTVVTIDTQQQMQWQERTFNAAGTETHRESYTLSLPNASGC